MKGKDISYDLEAQTRTIYALIDQKLQKMGGSLKNLVMSTTYVKEATINRDKVIAIRKEIFSDKNYPTSALIGIADLAKPGMLIEIQGIAVLED